MTTDKLSPEIPLALLVLIVDEVFDGAIEDASVIEDIYRVIARELQNAAPADCDDAFAARYSADPADPAVASELAVWREAWSAAGAFAARPAPGIGALAVALDGLLSITQDSHGVAGYRLNGEVAEWGDFPEVDTAWEVLDLYRAGTLLAAAPAGDRT